MTWNQTDFECLSGGRVYLIICICKKSSSVEAVGQLSSARNRRTESYTSSVRDIFAKRIDHERSCMRSDDKKF